jgi:DNA-binding MarR family transcriptional regulator
MAVMPTAAPPDTALATISDSFATVVRSAQLPRFYELIWARTGLRLDRSAFPLLRRIGEHDGVRLSDLADQMDVDVSTMSRQVRTLERGRLVVRQADAADARASLFTLTPRGERALERLRQARLEILGEVLADWSPKDRAQFAPLLERFAADVAGFARR